MLLSFEDYRDRILSIIDSAERYIAVDNPRDTEALDLCRTRMSRILTAYNLFAERELFGPCGNTVSNPVQKARIKALSAECAELALGFRNFARECAADPVLGRWTEYRLNARAMMARIRAHLHAAETEMLLCADARYEPSYRKAS